MQSTQDSRVTISVTQWQRATETLTERTKKEPRKKWIRHFRYDLQAGKISSWTAKEASSLFFEFEACSGVRINDEYILFELSDGADDASGCKLYQSFKYQNDPQRELILRRGIIAGDSLYSLIGSSNSGIQSHSYVFRRGTLEHNEHLMLELMPHLHRLEAKKGAAKRIKYQGLLFSGAQVIDLPPDVVSVDEIASVERERSHDGDKYDFTDGCGLISLKLAKYIQKQVLGLGLSKKNQSTAVPSIFHIRYAGKIRRPGRGSEGHICKGVFLVDYRNDETYEMCFRKSMLKEAVSDKCANILGRKIGIIGWSKESPGRLSQQLICLLTASVPDKVLEEIQLQHLQAIETATVNPLSAAWLAGLEIKATAWFAFQSLLHGAARDHQSGSQILSSDNAEKNGSSKDNSTHDKNVTAKIPSSYSLCTIGRSDPRHLSDNLTKVQVPLACCRTLFGAAFPETLSSSSDMREAHLKEEECIVMLEDGPLEDKIVIVSRSPSYHPGDVRVLLNRASELPLSHPVSQLRNCILFSTDGERPDADKMGGGDLDGDRFLIVWDSRLVKYSNEIKRHKSPDYNVAQPNDYHTKSMVMSWKTEKRRTDWIHAAAMTDSVMLGAIENSYYALAKEFGVQSDEVHQLNQLFSQLIDRKPAAIESFETLCRKAYNPQRVQRASGSLDDKLVNATVWERMLFNQRQMKEQTYNTSTSFDEYTIFRTRLLQLCDKQTFDHEIAKLQFHFKACLQKRRAAQAFHKFLELVASDEQPSELKSALPPKELTEAHITQDDFEARLKSIALDAEVALLKPLATLQAQQCRLIRVIQHQKNLYDDIEARFYNGQIGSINEAVESCRQKCALLRPMLNNAEANLSRYKQTLTEKKILLEQCMTEVNKLKDQESDLSSCIERNDAIIPALKELKADITQYACDIGVPKFIYCGSFLGQEKQHLMSKDNASRINAHVLAFNDSLNQTKASLSSESLINLKELDTIDFQESWAEHCHNIQKLQCNYSTAKLIRDLAESKLSPIVELLHDLTITREQHDTIKELAQKCEALISLCISSLQSSTSAFKHCLTLSDFSHLVQIIEQYPCLSSISEQLKKEIHDINQFNSDVHRYRLFYQGFNKFVRGIPLLEKRALLEKLTAKSKLEKLAKKREKQTVLSNETAELGRNLATVECEFNRMKEKLHNTYSPEDLEKAESDLEGGNEYEGSIQLGIDRIRHELKECSRLRTSTVDDSFSSSDSEDRLKRVCSIEKYRLSRSGGPLPVYKKRDELNRLIYSNDAIIITAQTGSGKSTQVPQYIADDSYTWMKNSSPNRGFRLCCTQPRRIAARSIAEHVAKEYHSKLGRRVGFRVGHRDGVGVTDSKKISDKTEIEYVTEGLLLAQLRASPQRIKNYDVIILDEAHERNIETDLLMAFLRNHLRRLKNDPQPDDIPLKVIVMSASIDYVRFCEYFDDCPRIDCPGKVYDVEEYYRPINEEEEASDNESDYLCSSSENNSTHRDFSKTFRSIADQERSLVEHAIEVLFQDIICAEREEGDVLIFFSGSREILECTDAINKRSRSENQAVVAYPLFSSMNEDEKTASKDPSHRSGLDEEKAPTTKYVRKVICCTNICETSLTIDGVRFVLDGGKAKKMRYNHNLRSFTLREEDVARASTKQRRGRAGRTQTGWCFYLYSQRTHNEMEEYEMPKILQTSVEQLILYSMYNCQCSIEELGLLDSPSLDVIEIAKRRLEDLGFVTYANTDERSVLHLTEDGELAGILSSVMSPESVRMVLWANTKCPIHRQRVLAMAALLSQDDDIFIGSRRIVTPLPSSSSGFTKTKSLSSIQIVRDESEHYAHELEQGTHQLGDHFLTLREFDSFERERKRQLKSTNNKTLRVWCKKHGLNYAALNQAQLAMERCHNELKKRKILADTNCAQEWTSDEAVIRAMISGYFHQLVESTDPFLRNKYAEFTILSPREQLRFKVRLDRDSCIWRLTGKVTTQSTEKVDFIPDNDDDEEDSLAEDFTAKSVTFSLLLFTRLQSVVFKSNGHELIFMRGATAIDVDWISDQVPDNWFDRVDVDPSHCNVICGFVRNVGPKVLARLRPLVQELKQESGAKAIELNTDQGQILIYGSQAIVVRAKETILKQVTNITSEFYKSVDASVCISSIGKFGSGLELQTLRESSSQRSSSIYKGWQLKELPKHNAPTACREPISIKSSANSPETFEVFVKFGWDTHLFSGIFNQVAVAFNFTIPRGTCSVIQKGVKFTFQINGSNTEEPTKPTASKQKRKSKSARKRKREGQGSENVDPTTGLDANTPFTLDECMNKVQSMIHEEVYKYMHTSSVKNIPSDQLPLLLALAYESRIQSHFWTSNFPSIQFSPSYGCFEMFNCTAEELKARILTLSTRKIVLSINDIAIQPGRDSPPPEQSTESTSESPSTSEDHHFTRSELCRFNATLQELRKSHPSVIWVAGYKTRPTLGENATENDQTKTTPESENLSSKVERKIGMLSPHTWLKSDYQRLLAVYDDRMKQGPVIELSVTIYSFARAQPMKAISDCRSKFKSFFLDAKLLNNMLPSKSECGTRFKVCVMCRRAIQIRFHRATEGMHNDHLQGYQLTVCGCAYCRECFRSSAEQFVERGDPVQCRNCKRQVLARDDCQKIMTPNYKEMKNDPYQRTLFNLHQKEWMNLLQKAERKYCSEILVGGGDFSGLLTCPDCGSHSVFNSSKPYFRCSSINCTNIFCCKCLRVPMSLTAEQQKVCADRKCQRHEED